MFTVLVATIPATAHAQQGLSIVQPATTLRVRVSPSDVAGLVATVDKRSIPIAELASGFAVEPGPHAIVVGAPGYLSTSEHRCMARCLRAAT